nr:MAG TPA: Replicative helicase [Caudoviricetes sp.]
MNFDISDLSISKQKAGDYEKDGIVYCGKCHTPKQHELKGYVNRVIWCNCECEDRAYEKRMEEIAENERKLYIENLRSNGIQDRKMLRFSFENDMGSETKESLLCRRYVSRWKENYAGNIGLIFWGDVGTGKTFYAGCIANALIELGIPVLATDFISILNELQGMREGRGSYLNELNQYKLLIIDDFGAERQSDYAVEQIFNVVNQRYKSNQPLILTTNMTMEQLRNPADVRYGRIYDRVCEMCLPVKFHGESMRKERVKEKQVLAKEINRDE